jgi:hypothetical protein
MFETHQGNVHLGCDFDKVMNVDGKDIKIMPLEQP